MTRVLIADDQPDMLAALMALIHDEPDLQLVGSAADADEAIDLARTHQPEIALIDFKMPAGGGPRAVREIAFCSPETKVIALSAYEDRSSVFQMLQAGAVAYLIKGTTAADIRKTIDRTLDGEAVLSPEISVDVVRGLAEHLERQSSSEEEERRKVERVQLALEPGSIEVVFQPVVKLESREVVGYEALARFALEPQRPPNEWFAEAHAVGLGVELQVAAIEAITAFAPCLPDAYLAVNVSAEALLSTAARDALSMLDPARLVIELTEHAVVHDYEALCESIDGLRRGGVLLAIDDAGAGFSSLRHILRLAPDLIKIDRSLTADVERNRGARALTSALVAFAREMGTGVVAEGIESEHSAEVLRELGAHYGQGWHFGRPAALPRR